MPIQSYDVTILFSSFFDQAMMNVCYSIFLFITVEIYGYTTSPENISGYTSTLIRHQRWNALHASPLSDDVEAIVGIHGGKQYSRRNVLTTSLALAVSTKYSRPQCANAADSDSVASLDTILAEIQIARQQMNAVPDLIKNEQWDGVRAVLIKPPLSDLWTKSARKSSLLQDYANVVGALPSGDELAVLEAKEDVEGHLRFLDMAAYNNNFNPIKSVGETGATKALISSYYDDPTNEFKATIAALDNLMQLGNSPK